LAQDFAAPHRKPSASAGRTRIERPCAIVARLEQLRIDSGKQTTRSREAPIFLTTASDDRHNADIQADAIGGVYGADHYHDDILGSRRPGSLVVAMRALALAASGTAGAFACCAMLGVCVFPAVPPIVKAAPDNNIWNISDTQRRSSSQTSLTSGEQQPTDIRAAPKKIPRVISAIPVASNPNAPPLHAAGSAAVAPPVPAATELALDPPMPSGLAPLASSVPRASGPEPAPSEPKETAAAAPLATAPALGPPVVAEASVLLPASAPVPVPASSEPKNIDMVIGTTGSGETDTSSPPALAPDSATSAAATPSVIGERSVGSTDAQGDAAPPPLPHSRIQVGRGAAGGASSGGSYAVQVASARSAAQAQASFRALRAKFPNQLGEREPIVRRIYLGAKGIYYRAMIGPFASMERAAGMCSTLKAAGGSCLVQRN
jgi:SPOR domain